MKSGPKKCSENCCVSSSPQSDILDNQSGSLMSPILLFAILSACTFVDTNQTESRVIMKNGSRCTRQKPQQAPFSIPEALTHQLDNIYITLQYTPQASNLLPLFASHQTVNQVGGFFFSFQKNKKSSVQNKFTLVAVVNSVFVVEERTLKWCLCLLRSLCKMFALPLWQFLSWGPQSEWCSFFLTGNIPPRKTPSLYYQEEARETEAQL